MIEHNNRVPPALVPDTASGEQKVKYDGIRLSESDESLLVSLRPQDQAVLRANGSYEERAHKLGLPLGTLRSRLHRARAKLVELRKQTDLTNSDTSLPERR